MQPLNVFTYGGGPAGEVLRHVPAGSMRPAFAVSRQSLISAVSAPGIAEIGPAPLSPVSRRVLEADLQGSLLNDVSRRAAETDALLWDLFDERFGVEALSDGTYITRSPEAAKYVAKGAKPRAVAFGTNEHFELWSAAADSFLGRLSKKGLLARTFLLNIAWASLDENKQDAELPFGLSSAEANRAFVRYVDYLRNAGVHVIDHCDTWTAREHRWGPAPYNLHDDVYRSIATKVGAALRDAAVQTADNAPEYDERHHAQIREWASIDEFNAVQDGRVHHVVAPGPGQVFHLRSLIQKNDSDTLLVISHGALPRAKYSLPRFEWLASLESRSENLMFLADTALENFDDLELAWFTGNEADNLSARYAQLVNRAARQLGATKILFMGGSGGGFASLALAAQTPGSRALVFNPQTNVRKYWNKAVNHYVTRLFTTFTSASQLATLGSRTDVTKCYAPLGLKNHQVIYVQNDDDGHHLVQHLEPFANAVGMRPEPGVSDDGNVRILIDHFGEGHSMPYRLVLNPCVDIGLANWGEPLTEDRSLPANTILSDLLAELGAERPPPAAPPELKKP